MGPAVVSVLAVASAAVAGRTGTDVAADVVVDAGTSGNVAIDATAVDASKVEDPAEATSCCENGTDPTDQPGSDLAVERVQISEVALACSND